MRSTRYGFLVVFASVMVTTGCAPEHSSEPSPSTPGADGGTEATVDEVSEKFLVWELGTNLNSSLLTFTQAYASDIKICLEGDGFTPANIPSYQNAAKSALMAWVDAIRPVSTARLFDASRVVFSCSSPQLTLRWVVAEHCGNANNNANMDLINFPNATIRLCGQGPSVLIHEMGHAFGQWDTYGVNTGVCRPGQPQSTMCRGDLYGAPMPDDILGVRESYCQRFSAQCRSRWSTATTFCTGVGQKLSTADFDGDGRADLVCHDPGAGTQAFFRASLSGTFTSQTSVFPTAWCVNRQLLVGDFNGDRRADMLCHDPVTGNDTIKYANAWGYFDSTSTVTNLSWCSGANKQLVNGDFNGDGRSDVLCRTTNGTNSWEMQIANAAGQIPAGTSWVGTLALCSGASDRLRIADLNNDRRADLVCNDSTGAYRTALASATGSFTSIAWSAASLPWINEFGTQAFCSGATSQLELADVNGDGRADLICHDGAAQQRIALSGSAGDFAGASRAWGANWCPTPTIAVGDFDANGAADELCQKGASGLGIHYENTFNATVATGVSQTCALKENGFVDCWGNNQSAQANPPPGLMLASLSLGANHSCGITPAGAITCWGSGAYGEATPPVGVFASMTTAWFHNCALRADGTLSCWGQNNWAQAPASRAGTYSALSAGGAHTCGILTSGTPGTIECWGLNQSGQAPASRPGPFIAVGSGQSHTCAIRQSTGSIECWGDNTYGQAPATRAGSYQAVYGGRHHTCALRTDRTIDCWGRNDLGQLNVPIGRFLRLHMRYDHACAVREPSVVSHPTVPFGTTACWGGDNYYGQTVPPL